MLVELNVVEMRRVHPGWGPRTILVWLDREGPTKTGSRRDVEMTDLLVSALHRHRKQQAERHLKVGPRWADLVFTSAVGTPVDPSHARRLADGRRRRTAPRRSPPRVADEQMVGHHTDDHAVMVCDVDLSVEFAAHRVLAPRPQITNDLGHFGQVGR